MEFSGRYRIGAPRTTVWAALNDPGKLGAAIPGCRRIAWTGPGSLELEMEVGIGFVKAVFAGELHLYDVEPARSYTLSGRGKGRLGRAEGAAKVALADLGEDTELRFSAVGGADNAIMKLGRALIGSAARKIIDHFFARFGETFGARVEPLAEADG